MSRSWVLILTTLMACSSLDSSVSENRARNPAAVGGACLRQSLGEATTENQPLVQYNTKRVEAVRQLLKAQIDKLTALNSKDEATAKRLVQLQVKMDSISNTAVNLSGEPNEVSWKLHGALDWYLTDLSTDEINKSLSDAEQKNLKYTRETLAPNLSSLEFWIPEFCKKTTGI